MGSSERFVRERLGEWPTRLPEHIRLHRRVARGLLVGLVLCAAALFLPATGWGLLVRNIALGLEFFLVGLAVAPGMRLWRIMPESAASASSSRSKG